MVVGGADPVDLVPLKGCDRPPYPLEQQSSGLDQPGRKQPPVVHSDAEDLISGMRCIQERVGICSVLRVHDAVPDARVGQALAYHLTS